MAHVYLFVDVRAMILPRRVSKENTQTYLGASVYIQEMLKKIEEVQGSTVKIIPFSRKNILNDLNEQKTNELVSLYQEFITKGLIIDQLLECDVDDKDEIIFPSYETLCKSDHRIKKENICVISPNLKLLEQLEEKFSYKVIPTAQAGQLTQLSKARIDEFFKEHKELASTKFNFFVDFDDTLWLLILSYMLGKIVLNSSLIMKLKEFKEIYPNTTFSLLTSRTNPLQTLEIILALSKIIDGLELSNDNLKSLKENLSKMLEIYNDLKRSSANNHGLLVKLINLSGYILKNTEAIINFLKQNHIDILKTIYQRCCQLSGKTSVNQDNSEIANLVRILQNKIDLWKQLSHEYSIGHTPENICQIIKEIVGLDIEIRENSYIAFEITNKRKATVIQEDKQTEDCIRFLIDDNVNEINFADELIKNNPSLRSSLYLCGVLYEGAFSASEVLAFIKNVQLLEQKSQVKVLTANMKQEAQALEQVKSTNQIENDSNRSAQISSI